MILESFDQFIAEENGEYLEESGSKPGDASYRQCVDLINGFLPRVRGSAKVLGTNAIDFPSKMIGFEWNWVPNNPLNDKHPGKGDIVVWKPSPGHIAVCIESDLKRFSSFDQNFPTGSPCHIQEHTYQNVLGWLVYKGVPTMNMYPATAPNIDLDNLASVKVAVDIWVRLQKGEFVDKSKYDADVKAAFDKGVASVTIPTPPPIDPLTSIEKILGLPENLYITGTIISRR